MTRTTTTRSSGGLFGRRRHNNHTTGTTANHHHNNGAHLDVHIGTNHNQPHHQKRRASIGDKISGAMLKLRGTLTRRPGLKAAGTRRMRGTDGRGSHRY
jgi:hypothetical protein